MKNLKFLPVIAMVLAVAFTLSMSSFKSVGKLIQPADGWYQVTIIGGSEVITGTTPLLSTEIPPLEDLDGCARTLNLGNTCAVHLVFTADVPIPATVTDAGSAANVTLGPLAKEPVQP